MYAQLACFATLLQILYATVILTLEENSVEFSKNKTVSIKELRDRFLLPSLRSGKFLLPIGSRDIGSAIFLLYLAVMFTQSLGWTLLSLSFFYRRIHLDISLYF